LCRLQTKQFVKYSSKLAQKPQPPLIVTQPLHMSPNSRDFSDLVQGEDMEFRESPQPNFNVTKIPALSVSLPPKLLTMLSANQLVTLAGAASGFLAGVVVCPLDVVKTRLQAQGAGYRERNPEAPRQVPKYSGFIGAFKTILREEGIRGLYRGLVPITIGYLPTWTIYFTVYERAKVFYPQFIREHFADRESATVSHFLSALTAGSASSVLVNPIWVVKTRLMIQTGKESNIYGDGKRVTHYKGTSDAFTTMYKEEGLGVFYSGLIPSLFGLLHVGIHFPVYEKLKQVLDCNLTPQHQGGDSLLLWRLIVASSVSKMIASTVTYPHEILRTRMQIQSSNAKKETGQAKKSKLLHIITRIYKKEGLRGFYAGYTINLARTVPASAVTLVSFEYFKTYLLEVTGHF
jgi:solute carrier family 25 folate transporter 32